MRTKNPFITKENYYGREHKCLSGLSHVLIRLAFISAIVGGGYAGWHYWLGPKLDNSCTYPYHLVYVGWQYELVGKVMTPVDHYWCEPN